MMSIHHLKSVLAMFAFVSLPQGLSWADASVSYQGYIYGDFGTPIVNGFGIVGTFAPSFDPNSYKCFYGDDSGCNLYSTHYSQAVADGNFRPIGPGDVTDASGFFSAAGVSTAAAGTPLYFFVFDAPNPDAALNFGMATGSDSAFLLPASGVTSIDTSMVNQFVFGYGYAGGILVSVLPFPEPATVVMGIAAVLSISLVRGRTRSKLAAVREL